MASEVDQPSSTQPRAEDNCGSQTEKVQPGIKTGHVIQNRNNLMIKSSDILRSAVTIFLSNFHLMFLMILSIIPLSTFMIFYEIKLQNTIQIARTRNFLNSLLVSKLTYSDHGFPRETENRFFSDSLQLFLFYSVLYPLLEFFSIVIPTKFAANFHSEQTQLSFKEIIDQTNIKHIFITYLFVHFLSALTFVGLFYMGVNHYVFTVSFSYTYDLDSVEFYANILSILLHSTTFVVLLYKYLGWSVFCNMGIVVTFGFGAFVLSNYYGKHCKKTGFQ